LMSHETFDSSYNNNIQMFSRQHGRKGNSHNT
jgi:hypothetical protein